MEPIKLIQPTEEYAAQIAAYRQEFLDAGDTMDGCGSLDRISDPLEWIAHEKLYLKPETTPPGRVPATMFLSVRESDDRLVGMIQVRHCFNEYLRNVAGNIGYSIRPSERRKGYATEQLRQALLYSKNTLKLDKVLISCEENNEGSRRAILHHGGVFDGTVLDRGDIVERYWIDLSDK